MHIIKTSFLPFRTPASSTAPYVRPLLFNMMLHATLKKTDPALLLAAFLKITSILENVITTTAGKLDNRTGALP